ESRIKSGGKKASLLFETLIKRPIGKIDLYCVPDSICGKGNSINSEIRKIGMSLITFYILAIIFVATLVRSTFGFGESLIAVPLLILLIPIEIAVPLSVLISIFIAAFVVVQDRRQIHVRSAKWLIV